MSARTHTTTWDETVCNWRTNVQAFTRQWGSQTAVAAAAGISRVQLNNILAGRSRPSGETMLNVANALSVQFEDLIGDPGKFASKYRRRITEAAAE